MVVLHYYAAGTLGQRPVEWRVDRFLTGCNWDDELMRYTYRGLGKVESGSCGGAVLLKVCNFSRGVLGIGSWMPVSQDLDHNDVPFSWKYFWA